MRSAWLWAWFLQGHVISSFIAGGVAGLCGCSGVYGWRDKCDSHNNTKSIHIQLWPWTQISVKSTIICLLLASHFLFHTCCCSYETQLFSHFFIFSDVHMWVNADDDCAVECVNFTQMEDPSLLEESSTLIDPNDPHRGAPLRLGSACFVFFFFS